jgi:hypothetical protein
MTRRVKTAEITDAALDWVVAKAEGRDIAGIQDQQVLVWNTCSLTGEREVVRVFQPSIDWSQGGPIIERMLASTNTLVLERRLERTSSEHLRYVASLSTPNGFFYGPTPLIAAMRCYVASKLGDEVDVPKELLP